MKRKNLSGFSSVLLLIAAGLIVVSLIFPWWRLDFFAPQYPEGLELVVYPNKLEGDIDNINSLNHYIGMSEFSQEDFPEFKFLPIVLIGLAIIVGIGAILRNKGYLFFLIGLFIIGGIVGLLDLKLRLDQYSKNLDPMAPIDYEPFSIPIVGGNVIANFNTYSLLGTGIYFAIAAFILLLIPLWKDRKK